MKQTIAVLSMVMTLSAVFAIAGSLRDRGGQRGRTGGVDAVGHERQDRCVNGDYQATFAGFYNGTGSATVDDKRVHLRAKLTNKSGQTAMFDAELTTNGPYFSGSSIVFGKRMTVRGRIDAARQSRVAATYFVDGHGGRLIAELPAGADLPDDDWEHHSRPAEHAPAGSTDAANTVGTQSGASPANPN